MPPISRFVYDDKAKRFRDERAGRFLPLREVARARDRFAEVQKAWVADLTGRVAAGQLTVPAWQAAMSQRVRLVHTAQYLLGVGGVNRATQADRRAIGRIVATQEQHLAGFARDLTAGKLTARQVAARSQQYMDAATTSHERGKTTGLGMPELPEYPGENVRCGGNCKCAWDVEEDADGWRATWVIDAEAEHCEDCLERAARYSPLVIAREDA